jgi:hypothetical protein
MATALLFSFYLISFFLFFFLIAIPFRVFLTSSLISDTFIMSSPSTPRRVRATPFRPQLMWCAGCFRVSKRDWTGVEPFEVICNFDAPGSKMCQHCEKKRVRGTARDEGNRCGF